MTRYGNEQLTDAELLTLIWAHHESADKIRRRDDAKKRLKRQEVIDQLKRDVGAE